MDETNNPAVEETDNQVKFTNPQEAMALAEGTLPAPSSVDEEFQRQYAQFSSAASLADLAEEYVYFSHGLLFTHGFWTADPINDYIRETGGDCAPFCVQSPYPFFKFFDGKDRNGNIVDANWNSQICVVRREKWPGLYRFLNTIGGRNNDTKTVSRLVPQKLPLLDTFAMAKRANLPDVIPYVDCYAFALMTNRRTIYFSPERRGDPWLPVPVLQRNPEQGMIRYAKSLLGDVSRPRSGTLEPTPAQALLASKIAKAIEAVKPVQFVGTDDELFREHGIDEKLLQRYKM